MLDAECRVHPGCQVAECLVMGGWVARWWVFIGWVGAECLVGGWVAEC